MSVSVLILTLNEEMNLPACLASLDWCDDIVVLDSGSSDRTLEIARAAGARVFKHNLDSEYQRRMYAMKEIQYRHPWVYNPDADEVCTDELRDEMIAIASDPSRPEAFFRARFKNMFMGRWIKHSSLYPTWNPRLLRPDRVRFEREVHMRCIGDGPAGRLQGHYLHYSFNNGLKAWFEKHNRYSSSEAHESLKSLRDGEIPWRQILSGHAETRRQGLKELSCHVPFRPFFRFFYMYVLRGGFLDGRQGYHYCRLIAAYEYMIVIKIMELKRREQGLPV